MPYQQTATRCVVRLRCLRGLSATTRAQCQALRAEAGYVALYSTTAQTHSSLSRSSKPNSKYASLPKQGGAKEDAIRRLRYNGSTTGACWGVVKRGERSAEKYV
jgi:hypothetical protein